MEKTGRNDPCPCGSGKKFKKCCESTMLGKRFKAHKLEITPLTQKVSNLSSLFKTPFPIIPIPKPPEPVPIPEEISQPALAENP